MKNIIYCTFILHKDLKPDLPFQDTVNNNWDTVLETKFSTPCLQSNICLRLLLFFRVVKPCVTYPIGQREKCHSRVEIGLWRDWTLGCDEPQRHQVNRKLMKSHHMERWYRQTLMGMPVPAEDSEYTYCSGLQAEHCQGCSSPRQGPMKGTHAKAVKKPISPILQMYPTDYLVNANIKSMHFRLCSLDSSIEHTEHKSIPVTIRKKISLTHIHTPRTS